MTSFEEHLADCHVEVVRLTRSGRTRCDVLGLMLTESYFRAPWDRLMEYCAWIALWVLGSDRLSRLTVGPAQIQLRHWLGAGAISSRTPSLRHILTTASWSASYDIAERLVPTETGLQQVAAVYRGEARSHHVGLLERAVRWATSIVATPHNKRLPAPRR